MTLSKVAPPNHVKPIGVEEGRGISHPDKAGSGPAGQTGHGPAAYVVMPWAWLQAQLLHVPWSPLCSFLCHHPSKPGLASGSTQLFLSCGYLTTYQSIANHYIQKPKCCLSVREIPSCNRVLCALGVCEKVCGEEQCPRRDAAAAAARCSKGVIETRAVIPDKSNTPQKCLVADTSGKNVRNEVSRG